MTTDKTKFFKLVDEHVRNRLGCFLAEMDIVTDEAGYSLCFRSLGGNRNSPARYACRYLRVPVDLISASVESGVLPTALIERLETELSALG